MKKLIILLFISVVFSCNESTKGISEYELIENWAKIYDLEPTDALLQQVVAAFGDYDFVINFEGNSLILACLSRLGIPYIDVVLHPVRYLEDICLAFRGSTPEITERFKPFLLDPELFYIEASNIKACLMKGKQDNPDDIDIAVFGQTNDDKVLIKNGTFLNLAAPKVSAAMTKQLGGCSFLFKAHPLGDGDFGIYRSGVRFDQVIPTDINFYRLLSSGHLKTVISVASSVSVEAKYFGIDGVHLAEYPMRFWPESDSPDAYVPLAHEYFWSSFWKAALTEGDKNSPQRGFIGRNRLRYSLKNDWGYFDISGAM